MSGIQLPSSREPPPPPPPPELEALKDHGDKGDVQKKLLQHDSASVRQLYQQLNDLSSTDLLFEASTSRTPSPPRRRRLSRSPRPYSRSRVNTLTEGDLVVSETTHLINDAERPCEGGQRGALRHKEFEGHKGRSKVEEGGFKGNECQSGADQQDRQFLASPSSSQSPDKISPTLRAFRKQYSSTGGGSESGTEADDELPKKLPAPPSRRRRKWDFESNEEEDGDEGVDSANSGALRDEGDTEIAGGARSWRRRRISIGGKGIREEVYLGITGLGVKGRKILFVQRGIEIGLVVILVESVLMGKRADGEGRLWNVVVEDWIVALSWLFMAIVLIGRCGLYVTLRARRPQSLSHAKPTPPGTIQLPRSLDPSPLLYPLVLPPLVGISVSPELLLQNLVISIASLPPVLFPDFSIFWTTSLLPLFASHVSSSTSVPSLNDEIIACLPLLQHYLTDILSMILEPSLTTTEVRLLSASLNNLLISTTSPQAIILKALLWVGGIGVMLGCSDLVTWGVQLARIPRHRFRRVANVVRGVGRFKNVFRRQIKKSPGYVSSSADEGEELLLKQSTPSMEKVEFKLKDIDGGTNRIPISIILNPSTTGSDPINHNQSGSHHHRTGGVTSQPPPPPTNRRKRAHSSTSAYTSLTYEQAIRRKYTYVAIIYLIVFGLVFVVLRPYIAHEALHDVDPFPWAASYLFCGLEGYSKLTASISNLLGHPVSNEGDHWTGCSVWKNTHEWSPSATEGLTASSIANRRLWITLYWTLIFTAILSMVLAVKKVVEVDTRRKVFHGMVVGMFLIPGIIDTQFTHLALSLVLAVFLLLDLFRAAQIPPISKPLSQFLTPFVDGRDLRGPVVVSHVFLLVGCALPIWLTHAASFNKAGEGAGGRKELSFLSGVVCVGLGDSAASLIGRRFGKHKWGWPGGKSLEGSLSLCLAVLLGLVVSRSWVVVLNSYQEQQDHGVGWKMMRVPEEAVPWEWSVGIWGKLAVASAGAGLLEAVVMGVNDNVAVPVAMWLLVRALGV